MYVDYRMYAPDQRHFELDTVIKFSADGTGGVEILPAITGYYIYVYSYSIRTEGTALVVRLTADPTGASPQFIHVGDVIAANTTYNYGRSSGIARTPISTSVGFITSAIGPVYLEIQGVYRRL